MTLRLPNSKLAAAPTLDGYQMTLSGVNPNIILRDSCVYMLTTPGSGAITIENSVADNALIMLVGESYAGSATLASGGNVLLSSTYTPSVGSALTLLWTGSLWQETARGALAVVTPVTSVGGTAPIASSGGTTPVISLNDDGVTFAKMQEITTDRLIGRDTAATGNPEEISVGGGLEFTGSASIQRSALTGNVTASAGSGTTTIAADVVANSMLVNMADSTIKGRAVGAGTGDPSDLNATDASAVIHSVIAKGPAGTAAAPTYGFSTDTNSGIYSVSNDILGFSTNSTLRFDISTAGITTALPLTVNSGGANTAAVLTLKNTAGDINVFRTDATPESAVTGSIGDLAVDSTNGIVHLKETGTATTTGWIPVLTGSVVTAEITDAAVTLAKMANIATNSLIGRDTALTGVPESILLNATLEMDGSLNLQRAALTGNVTAPAGSNATTIATAAVTSAMLRNSALLSVIGRSANSAGVPADIAAVAASGSVLRESGSTIGFGTIATAGITDAAVTLAKMANMATNSLIGRDTALSGVPEIISLNATLSMDGSLNLQRAALTGDVTASAGSNATTLIASLKTGRLVDISYKTSGTTFTTNAATNTILVKVLAGGGGGAGANSAAGQASAGSGGAAGGYAEKLFAVSPSTGYTMAIGAGGGGGTGAANGTVGNDSTFAVGATTVTAFGGPPGVQQGTGTSLLTTNGAASPAVSTNGDLNMGGTPGTYGLRLSGTVCRSGTGGSCAFGASGGDRATHGNGQAGVGFGAGGSGAASLNGAADTTGSTGRAGLIIIEEYT